MIAQIDLASTLTASEKKMATILVTGGSGYVGSHCVLQLLNHDYQVLVIDNLVNSILLPGDKLPESLKRVERITGKKIANFYNGSIEDSGLLGQIFESYQVDIVLHFAALKAVGESVAKPLVYYRNNVSNTINLLSVMQKYAVKKFIFSSSATVYGKWHFAMLHLLMTVLNQGTQPICLWTRNTRLVIRARIPTEEESSWWRKFSRICARPTAIGQ